MTFLHSLLAFAVILLFSVNILAVKIAVEESSPVIFAVLRFAIVALALLPFFRMRRPSLNMLCASVFMGVHFLLLFVALSLSHGVGPVAIGLQMLVPFAALLGGLFLGERLSLPAGTGIAVAFAGVVSLGFDPVVFEHIDGLLIVFASAFSQAVATLFMRRLKGLHPLHMQLWISLVALPLMVVIGGIAGSGEAWATVELTPLFAGAILVAVVCGSIAGHGGLFFLVQRYPMAIATSLTMAVPVFATFLSYVFLDEILSPRIIIGGLVTLAGVALIQFGRYFRKPPNEVH